MKIKSIRKVSEEEQRKAPAACSPAPGDAPDKPPC